MRDGLIFVWVEKEEISNVLDYFEKQEIKYVENVIWITLDSTKKGNTRSSQGDPFNIEDLMQKGSYTYFTKTKKTLLIFRKVVNARKNLVPAQQ